MELIPKSIEAFFEWFGELDVEYHVVVISALTTLVVMILGHKLRPWIGCKLGIHNWQFIDLQRQENDFQSYGRVCWDDCLIQVWTSSGFVDRVETYAVRRRASPPRQDPIIFVGDVIGTKDYMLSGDIPYIVKRINADVVMRILEDATVNGCSYDDVFRNEYAVFRGDLDALFKCPTYRKRRSYELKRSARRQKLSAQNWVKSRLPHPMNWIRRLKSQ